jgi:hypothetical protein
MRSAGYFSHEVPIRHNKIHALCGACVQGVQVSTVLSCMKVEIFAGSSDVISVVGSPETVISGSLSARHVASSRCEWRNGLHCGG